MVSLNTFTHLDPFAAGILLATVPRSRLANLRLSSRLGLLGLGLASWSLGSYGSHPVGNMFAIFAGYQLIALGSAAFLVAALGAGKIAGFMLNRQLIYLGKISYGLYIWHRLAISLTLEACAMLGRGACDTEWLLLRAALSFAGTVVFASVSYRLLESPFLKLKRGFTYIPSRPV